MRRLAVVLVLVLAACGGDDGPSEATCRAAADRVAELEAAGTPDKMAELEATIDELDDLLATLDECAS